MKIKKSVHWSAVMVFLPLYVPAQAAEAPKVDTGDTAWFSGVQG